MFWYEEKIDCGDLFRWVMIRWREGKKIVDGDRNLGFYEIRYMKGIK